MVSPTAVTGWRMYLSAYGSRLVGQCQASVEGIAGAFEAVSTTVALVMGLPPALWAVTRSRHEPAA